jgi:glyoxylase-like metal-dependent hydrolase (beta-lactamase superfamily II)
MNNRRLLASGCLLLLGMIAWFSNAQIQTKSEDSSWVKVAPGIYRCKLNAYSYAIVDGENAILIDASIPLDDLKSLEVQKIDFVLLTHPHRDSVRKVGEYLKAKIPVRASKNSAEVLTVEGVKKYWQESIPLRNSRTSYFVVPEGFQGIDCSLEDQQKIEWKGRTIEVIATPGHSRDHLAFALTSEKEKSPIVFCGDAFYEKGKIWAPFTTDWDHWTDAGLKPTYESLRKLAELKPSALYLAHGNPVTKDIPNVLEETAKAVEEVAFLKSFERFSDRLGDAPKYDFLVPKEQVGSGGDKPWSKVSEHLYLTGNTYVLISKEENAFLVMDPWGKRSVDQIAKLKKDQQLGSLEVVMFSHAHYDHYDGVYDLPDRDKFQVWSLDRVAAPIAEPFLMRAPFLDSRPVKFDKTFKEGDTSKWREYSFKFHFFPGQSEFTMAVEAQIDGKKCLFTADNFFHMRQYSGSGGWMGLNRSFPLPYSESAQKVLDLSPDWILAEHGGPYVFNAEDYRRRVKWGQVSAKAADAISPTGNHRRDWDPNRITFSPILFKAKPGETLKGNLIVSKAAKDTPIKTLLLLLGREWAITDPIPVEKVPFSQAVEIQLSKDIPKGRHIFVIEEIMDNRIEGVDAFVAVDIE